ncbi:MAG: phosphatidate cytidylyltransferase [Acidobacteriota bacterium]
MIRAREATAFLLIPIVVAGIWYLPPWVYLAVVWLIGMMAAWELLALQRALTHPVQRVPTLVALGLALPALWWGGLPNGGWILAAVVLLVPLVYLLGRRPIEGATAGIADAVFTAVFFAVTGGAMGLLRTAFPGALGAKVVLTHCLTVWAGDSGAFYLGTRFGRHRLAPQVSPKKSWEGAVGGAAGTLFGVWFCRTVFFPELSWLGAGVLAVALTILAPLGDLVESLFKRDAGVKDSSALIPGHGGFLDRTDSLFYAAPFVLALLLAVQGALVP